MARTTHNQFHIPKDPERKPSWFWVVALLCMGFFGPIGWIGVLAGGYMGYKRFKRDGKIKQLSQFRKMANVIGDRGQVNIHELTARLGLSEKDVTDALQEMIDKGYIEGGAYINHSTMMLYLNDAGATYAGAPTININIGAQGVSSSTSWQGAAPQPIQPEPQKAQPAQQPRKSAPQPKRTGTENEDFESKLREIRELNDAIDDKEVSDRIDRIGELTASIFRVVREKPEHAEEVRKFMNYYLPTTLKLLKSYSLMEKQSYQGENIQAARKKIESILDTLIHAFEQQQDRLFRSEAMDVESDISVLETMMASDGLLENELKLRPSGGGMK